MWVVATEVNVLWINASAPRMNVSRFINATKGVQADFSEACPRPAQNVVCRSSCQRIHQLFVVRGNIYLAHGLLSRICSPRIKKRNGIGTMRMDRNASREEAHS